MAMTDPCMGCGLDLETVSSLRCSVCGIGACQDCQAMIFGDSDDDSSSDVNIELLCTCFECRLLRRAKE